MISTSQKEHLTYTLILQCAIILWIGIVAWTYILPWVEKINANEVAAQWVIDDYNGVKENGMNFDVLGKELSETQWKEELLKLIRSAPTDAREIITKSGKWEYIQWLNNAIANSDEDKKKLSQVKQKINSILPTMSPISNSLDEEYITLKEYIRFIETKFLAAFDIKSNIVLGIQGVSYPPEFGWTIGTFDLRLDFRATNSNIQKLITYVNESWDPTILSFTGILTEDKIPKILSNPLMTVETLSLENVLDSGRPDAINNGRVTIRFYVRGSSQEDIIFLKWAIATRRENLEKAVTKAIEECKKQELLCTELTRLEGFEKKYNEFSRSLKAINGVESGDMTILWQIATSLRALSDEFDTITQKK